MKINYDISVDYYDIVGSDSRGDWRITKRQPINKTLDQLTVFGMGRWIHNQETGYCTRFVRTDYRLNQLIHRLKMNGITNVKIREVVC